MGDILRRRGMMVETNAGQQLITFPDLTNYSYNPDVSQCKITVSNGNHFYYAGYRRGSAGTCYLNETTAQLAAPSGWPSMIDLHAGDELVMKLKNVTLYCAKTSSYNGYAQVTLRDASNTFIAGWGGNDSTSPLYVVGQQRITYDELIYTKTITDDTSVCMLRFYEYGTHQAIQIQLTCDLEVYVNGVRRI